MSSRVDDAAAQHVVRTLRALELLASGPQTQAGLARDLVVHRRTARRLLTRLVAEGYATSVEVGNTTAYAPTPRLVVLGRQIADGLDLVQLGRPHLSGLAAPDVTSRFIALLGDDGAWTAFMEPIDSDGTERRAEPLAHSGSLHATAAGKVFLSADNALAGEVLNQELLAFTPATLTKRGDLLLELAEVRAQGYAVEDGEHRVDFRAVASGVRDHRGKTVAAVGATLSSSAEPHPVGQQVRAVAIAFSDEIGAPPLGDSRPI